MEFFFFSFESTIKCISDYQCTPSNSSCAKPGGSTTISGRYIFEVCLCNIARVVYLWTMKKKRFSPLKVKLPPVFGFYSGCSLPIDRHTIMLIGGHYIEDDNNGIVKRMILVKYPANNQVAQLNIRRRKWNLLPGVPIPNVIILKKD